VIGGVWGEAPWLRHAPELVVFSLAAGRYGTPQVFTDADRFGSAVLQGLEIVVGELFV